MKLRMLCLFLVSIALLTGLDPQPVGAQDASGMDLENVVALVSFGEQITFVATIKSPFPVREASIAILDEAEGTTQIEPLIVQGDGRMEFRYDVRKTPLRPFSVLSWTYRLTLPDGSIRNSEIYSALYQDNRFNWQTIESGMLRVHWYDGDANFGQAALDTAQAGQEAVGHLIPAELTKPVDFYIYANLDDLRGTLVPGSQDWIAGHADPTLGVVMVTVEPGPQQEIIMQQRIPHELMHVMLYRALGDGYRNVPSWLSEGTAGLAELVQNSTYDNTLQEAVTRGDWIPLNNLCNSFPFDSDRALLAYAEARSFANFIHQKYGSSGLFNLARTYAGGAVCEQGPELAFGVSLAALETDWHASLSGKNALTPALQNITPYLVLLCLILLVPMISILGTRRRKASSNEPETYIRK